MSMHVGWYPKSIRQVLGFAGMFDSRELTKDVPEQFKI
jgi:hypothetical protein